MAMPCNTLENVLSKCIRNERGCLIYPTKRRPMISVNGRMMAGARAVWMWLHDPLLSGEQVLHQCDDGHCLEPTHLFKGTHQDNMDDRNAKGRQARGDRNGSRLKPERLLRGDRHPNSRLSEEVVGAIRERYGRGDISQAQLAKAYGVRQGTIANIVLGKRWTHIAHDEPIGRPSWRKGRRLSDEHRAHTGAALRASPRPSEAQKGIHAGERSGAAKLKDEHIREIRERYRAGGVIMLGLALEYGVSTSNINSILKRRSWAHIP